MEIDIESLSEEELVALNHNIVERLKALRQMKTHEKMLDFKIGQHVRFIAPSGERISGLLIRFNKKTVTVVTEGGQRWNVSPGFLKPVDKPRAGKVRQLRRFEI